MSIASLRAAQRGHETPETHMAFSLAWMTSNARYDFKALQKMKGNDAVPLESLFEFLENLSKQPWSWTKHRNRFNGGYEELPISEMNPVILDNVPDAIRSGLETLMVFRFNKSKDRLVAIKRGSILYLLGFDLNFTLYNHGS